MRDSALAAAGLLSERIGGPSVFPPQPASVSEGSYGGMNWNVSQGPDRFRRGLYTFSKRTSPFAMFATFDGPSGEECIARREVSNTPLQALTLLNDAQFVEIARGLARGRARQIGWTQRADCAGPVPPLSGAPAGPIRTRGSRDVLCSDAGPLRGRSGWRKKDRVRRGAGRLGGGGQVRPRSVGRVDSRRPRPAEPR